MATEPRALVRWALARVAADPTLVSLIATGAAWDTLPRSAVTADVPGQPPGKPGLAFGIQSTQTPTGAIQDGSRTWAEQTCVLRAQVSKQTWSRIQIEAIETELLRLFDGVFGQALADGGELIECRYLAQLPDIKEALGDEQVWTGTLWFQASLKVYN